MYLLPGSVSLTTSNIWVSVIPSETLTGCDALYTGLVSLLYPFNRTSSSLCSSVFLTLGDGPPAKRRNKSNISYKTLEVCRNFSGNKSSTNTCCHVSMLYCTTFGGNILTGNNIIKSELEMYLLRLTDAKECKGQIIGHVTSWLLVGKVMVCHVSCGWSKSAKIKK